MSMQILSNEDVGLLADVAWLAAATGNLRETQRITDALALSRPQAGMPHLCMALAQINRKQYEEAVNTLDRALVIPGQTDAKDLQPVRALALSLAGRPIEAARSLRASGDHPLAVALADEGLPGLSLQARE